MRLTLFQEIPCFSECCQDVAETTLNNDVESGFEVLSDGYHLQNNVLNQLQYLMIILLCMFD